MTKDEIKAKLTELGIEFDESATKAELEALLPEGSFEPKSESEARKAFKAIIESYKKSNPEKYELKKDELEVKLSKIK